MIPFNSLSPKCLCCIAGVQQQRCQGTEDWSPCSWLLGGFLCNTTFQQCDRAVGQLLAVV